jgi:hypothetical protein
MAKLPLLSVGSFFQQIDSCVLTGLPSYSFAELHGILHVVVASEQTTRHIFPHCHYCHGLQVMCVMNSGEDASKEFRVQRWDETVVDTVVHCSMHQHIQVRMMSFDKQRTRAIYGRVPLRVTPGGNGYIMVDVCDSHYNSKGLKHWVPLRDLGSQRTTVFLTQGLQLPSGTILQPGTSVHQVSQRYSS